MNDEHMAAIILAIMALGMAFSINRIEDAREVRLIGQCNGKIYAGLEEDEFPKGCLWIEPIKTQGEVS